MKRTLTHTLKHRTEKKNYISFLPISRLKQRNCDGIFRVLFNRFGFLKWIFCLFSSLSKLFFYRFYSALFMFLVISIIFCQFFFAKKKYFWCDAHKRHRSYTVRVCVCRNCENDRKSQISIQYGGEATMRNKVLFVSFRSRWQYLIHTCQ